jgi:rare lipoprotein A
MDKLSHLMKYPSRALKYNEDMLCDIRQLFSTFPIIWMAIFLTSLTSLTSLTGCSHIAKKDGPPSFYVDTSRIPNASPKVEPLSKYGNLTSYRVLGKRYYTLRSSRNYEQIGIASWYGTKFHAHRTSSGEPYNMLAMTAAHKTLPLPTYVEVTNLKNQRKIIVKVNDRGPFEGNRLIDLSYVAAKKLGITGHGTAKVKVKAIDPTIFGQPSFHMVSNTPQRKIVAANNKYLRHKNKTVSTLHHHQTFYLQVGAFHNKYHAEKFRRHLLSLIKAPIKVSKSPINHQVYRVQIGPIQNMLAVNKMTSQLKRWGIKTNKVNGALRLY